MTPTSAYASKPTNGWRAAAEQGCADAQYTVGMVNLFFPGLWLESTEETPRWFRLAAEQGHTDARFQLGCLYYEGRFVPKDHIEAAKHFLIAAEQGQVDAQLWLGDMYLHGVGMPYAPQKLATKWSRLDAAQAGPSDHICKEKWTRIAAEEGLVYAQCLLGIMYSDARRVPQDFIQSYAWLSVAALNGCPISEKYYLAKVAAKLTPDQLAEAQALTEEYFDLAPSFHDVEDPDLPRGR